MSEAEETTKDAVEQVLCESSQLLAYKLTPELKHHLVQDPYPYIFERLARTHDGRLLATIVEDRSNNAIRFPDFDEPIGSKWPRRVVEVSVALAFEIQRWFLTATELKDRRAANVSLQNETAQVLCNAKLDPASTTEQRAQLFVKESLDDPSIETRRQQLLKDHRLDDLSVVNRRHGCLEKYRLDDATVEALRQAELKRHGLT